MAKFAAGLLLGAISGAAGALLLIRWTTERYEDEQRRAHA